MRAVPAFIIAERWEAKKKRQNNGGETSVVIMLRMMFPHAERL
jgi:hypothetical protein